MISEEKVSSAVGYLRDKAEIAAKARATRLYLEDFTKHLKAKLARQHEGSNAYQIMMAESSEEYKQHLDALRIAIEADEKHRHMMEAAKTLIEVWRTESSNERALGKI